MHILTAMQLPGPELAGVFNMGGAGVANYVSVLEAVLYLQIIRQRQALRRGDDLVARLELRLRLREIA